MNQSNKSGWGTICSTIPQLRVKNCSYEELQTEDIIDVQIDGFEWQLKKYN